MILSFALSLFRRRRRFSWSPDLDLRDHSVYSTLLPGAQY